MINNLARAGQTPLILRDTLSTAPSCGFKIAGLFQTAALAGKSFGDSCWAFTVDAD